MRSWRAACISVVLLVSWPIAAMAQATVTVAANPSTLGLIPEGGTFREVRFTVPEQMLVRSIRIDVQIAFFRLSQLGATLVGPDSARSHEVATAVDAPRALSGLYGFSDLATGTLLQAPGVGTIPSGLYRTSAGRSAATSIDATFTGALAKGTWILRLRDYVSDGDSNAISAATLTISGVPVAEATATPGTLGAIPDATSSTLFTPGPPRDVAFTVPAGRGPVRGVRVSATLLHPSVGQVLAELISPSGASHVLFAYTGVGYATGTSTFPLGFSSDLAGSYTFDDDGGGGLWWATAVTVQTGVIPSGEFYTSQIGGPPGSTGANTLMNQVFAGTPSAGVWILRLRDGIMGTPGGQSASGALLTLETFATPTTNADSFSTTSPIPRSVAAPGVLVNDTDNLGGAMTAELVAGPARGTVSLASSGAFIYTPNVGFVGTDSFTYRAVTSAGPGNVATVSIVVAAPTTVQPPAAFEVSSVVASEVTLRWTPSPLGPPATDFVVEGGVAPGQVLGAVVVGGPLPLLTFTGPTGAFFVRVHALANGQRSGPSNEVTLFVNTNTPPSAPAALLGSVNGGALALSWRNTFAGGAPSSNVVDITGNATATIPVPLGETFAFNGVPGGTYTFRARAANSAGTSGTSNGVTLTFPQGCAGAPAPPERVLAYAVGRVITLVWDPPSSGPAATSYLLTVGGAYTGILPLGSARVLRAPAPPGAYTLSVVATNACGASAASPVQTVFVP